MIRYGTFVNVNMQITEMELGRHRKHRATSRRKFNACTAIISNSNNVVGILIAAFYFVTTVTTHNGKSHKCVREIRCCNS